MKLKYNYDHNKKLIINFQIFLIFKNNYTKIFNMSKAKMIKIPISSIAPLVGFDNYNNFPKTVCELLRKYQKEKFEQIEKSFQSKDIEIATDSEARKLVRHDKKHGSNLYQQVKTINNIKTTSQQLVSNQNLILKKTLASTSISQEEKDKIKKQVESMTNKSHGIKSEDDVLKRFEQESNMKIESGQKWMTCPFVMDKNSVQWAFHGKYDGKTSCGKIIEAKKRQRGLFKRLRDYEKIQIQSYLFGTQSIQGYLVESYSHANGMDFNMILVDFDSDFVNQTIINRLTSFVNFFMDLLDNPDWQNTIIQNDKERLLYQTYLNQYLKI